MYRNYVKLLDVRFFHQQIQETLMSKVIREKLFLEEKICTAQSIPVEYFILLFSAVKLWQERLADY